MPNRACFVDVTQCEGRVGSKLEGVEVMGKRRNKSLNWWGVRSKKPMKPSEVVRDMTPDDAEKILSIFTAAQERRQQSKR